MKWRSPWGVGRRGIGQRSSVPATAKAAKLKQCIQSISHVFVPFGMVSFGLSEQWSWFPILPKKNKLLSQRLWLPVYDRVFLGMYDIWEDIESYIFQVRVYF